MQHVIMFAPQFVAVSLHTVEGPLKPHGGPGEVTAAPETLPVLLRASREGLRHVPFSG